MPVSARPMPRAAARPGAVPHRPVRAAPRHAPEPKKKAGADTLRYALIGAGLAAAAVIGVTVIWEFGAARNLAVPYGAIGSGGAPVREGPATTMYRDMHDGRVMVMEVGPNGTRLKGTVAKSSLPIANDEDHDSNSSDSRREPSAVDRVNALGSAFR